MADLLAREGLARFGAVAAAQVDRGTVPGLVALVARGDQVHVEARGALAVGGEPVRRDSLFRISSTTKPITAAAALALVAEGRFGLDEPVDRLLPGARRAVRACDRRTVRGRAAHADLRTARYARHRFRRRGHVSACDRVRTGRPAGVGSARGSVE